MAFPAELVNEGEHVVVSTRAHVLHRLTVADRSSRVADDGT